jgi:hypothetical protein
MTKSYEQAFLESLASEYQEDAAQAYREFEIIRERQPYRTRQLITYQQITRYRYAEARKTLWKCLG